VTVNVPPLAALVTGANLASILELETVYSYDDLLDMAEIIQVQRYNEWAAMKAQENKHGNNR
jgi:hypothetical protein